MSTNKYTQFITQAKRGVAYWTRVAMRDFTDDLLKKMTAREMTNAALAKAADVSPAYVTKILRGSENFTLETMTKLAMAVGGKVRVHISDQSTRTHWVDSLPIVTPPTNEPANTALNVFIMNTNASPIREVRIDRAVPQSPAADVA